MFLIFFSIYKLENKKNDILITKQLWYDDSVKESVYFNSHFCFKGGETAF